MPRRRRLALLGLPALGAAACGKIALQGAKETSTYAAADRPVPAPAGLRAILLAS